MLIWKPNLDRTFQTRLISSFHNFLLSPPLKVISFSSGSNTITGDSIFFHHQLILIWSTPKFYGFNAAFNQRFNMPNINRFPTVDIVQLKSTSSYFHRGLQLWLKRLVFDLIPYFDFNALGGFEFLFLDEGWMLLNFELELVLLHWYLLQNWFDERLTWLQFCFRFCSQFFFYKMINIVCYECWLLNADWFYSHFLFCLLISLILTFD